MPNDSNLNRLEGLREELATLRDDGGWDENSGDLRNINECILACEKLLAHLDTFDREFGTDFLL